MRKLSEEQAKNIAIAGVNAMIKELREAGIPDEDVTPTVLIRLTVDIADKLQELFS